MNRDSESLEIHAGVLDPRYNPGPPCGLINGDVESHKFVFLNSGYFMLHWHFAGAVLANQVVLIMRINNDRPATVVTRARAFGRIQYLNFLALAGQHYYIRLLARQPVTMAWWFENSAPYGFSVTLFSYALANPSKQVKNNENLVENRVIHLWIWIGLIFPRLGMGFALIRATTHSVAKLISGCGGCSVRSGLYQYAGGLFRCIVVRLAGLEMIFYVWAWTWKHNDW